MVQLYPFCPSISSHKFQEPDRWDWTDVMACLKIKLTPGVYLWISMHLSGLNLLSFPPLQDLILRFYLFKNKEATARISVKQKQFSKLENKSCLMLQINRKGSQFLKRCTSKPAATFRQADGFPFPWKDEDFRSFVYKLTEPSFTFKMSTCNFIFCLIHC